jgi:hypothetical protein
MESITCSGGTDIDRILNSELWIEPVGRLHLAASAQAEENGVGHVTLGKADSS